MGLNKLKSQKIYLVQLIYLMIEFLNLFCSKILFWSDNTFLYKKKKKRLLKVLLKVELLFRHLPLKTKL